MLSVWPKAILGDLRNAGRDVDAIFDEAGLDLRAVNRDGARISWPAQARLMEIAARELDDDCYGVRLSTRVDVRDADALAYLGLASRTFGDALDNLARYLQVFTEAIQLGVSRADDTVIVTMNPVDPSYLQYSQQAEFGAGLLLNYWRLVVGRDIRPLEASFVHGRNARRGEVARCLGCPIVFGEDHVRIVLKASDMADPIATADDRLLKILRTHCEATLKEHGTREPGLLQAVERRIIELLPTGAAKAKVIAVDLGMSDRTLTRKLAMEGTSFDAVLDRLRHQLAVKYVTSSNLSLTQVAFLLGYANQPAFSTAFRRWSGQSPSELRRH